MVDGSAPQREAMAEETATGAASATEMAFHETDFPFTTKEEGGVDCDGENGGGYSAHYSHKCINFGQSQYSHYIKVHAKTFHSTSIPHKFDQAESSMASTIK